MKSLKNLLYEANKDPMMNLSGKNKPFTNKKLNEFLKRSKPIKSKGKTIGFYMIGKSISGDPKIDNIFITKSERQKGYAYKASRRFLKNFTRLAGPTTCRPKGPGSVCIWLKALPDFIREK